MTQVSLTPDEMTGWIQQVAASIDKGAANKANSAVDFARVLQVATDALEPTTSTTGTSAGDDSDSTTGSTADALAAAALEEAESGTGTDSTDSTSSLDSLESLLGSTTTDGTTATDGTDVVADAQKYLGVPYVWGGTDPSTGLDCSGLTQRVYADLGYDLPRTAAEQATVGTAVASTADLQPGDLIFFGSPVHHVVIYAGENAAGVPQIIEAPHTGEDVRETSLAAAISADGEPTAMRRILGDSSLVDGSTSTSTASADAITSRGSSSSSATPYASLFAAASASTGVPTKLLEAVAQQESGFDADATSPTGAEGIMQLMPSTAASLGVTDPDDPAQSIEAGATYLHRLLTEFGGNTTLALAAYNAGPGAVAKYGGVPPYAETQQYVKDVESLMGGES